MKKRIMKIICVAAAIIIIVSGVILVKTAAKRHNPPNVLPAVDTLVIEDGSMLVYN